MEVISIKIPRTGSESFGAVLHDLYGQSELRNFIGGMKFNPKIYDPKSWWYAYDHITGIFQDELQEFKPYDDQQYVHNHVPVELFDGWYDECPRIAFMREPVSWIISCFWFAKMLSHIPEEMGIWEYIELDYRKNWVSMMLGGSLDRFDWIGFQETWLHSVKEFLNRFTNVGETFFWEKPVPTRNVNIDDRYIRFRDDTLKDKAFVRRFKSLHKEDIKLYEEATNVYTTRKS